MDQKTGTAATQPSHFIADTVGARYEPDAPGTQRAKEQVHPGEDARGRAEAGPRTGRIVVGVDGSPVSLKALNRAAHLADLLNTKLEIITTWQQYVAYAETVAVDWSPARDAQEIVAEAAGAEFGGTVPDWVTASTREGTAAHQLIEASRGADMLVLGSRGHGGVVGLLLGSVSSACAEEAYCPVLVVR
jgi:nucleotide-binding universal stress UspA family protein